MLPPSTVTNAKSQAKPYKLADERGMYLLVKADGAKWWRFDYRRPNTRKRNTLSLGTFPDVSLRKARDRLDELRKLLADGIDPGDKRKATRTPMPTPLKPRRAKSKTLAANQGLYHRGEPFAARARRRRGRVRRRGRRGAADRNQLVPGRP